MENYLSEEERKNICEHFENRGFTMELDEERHVVVASINDVTYETPYRFYRKLFGVSVSAHNDN